MSTAPTAPTTAQSLFDFYTTGICLPKLADGKHTAKLLKDSIEQKDGSTYVRLDWQLEDRVVCDARSDAGFKILISQARDVLNITAPTPVPALLGMLRTTEVEFYVKHLTLSTGKAVVNYSLRPFQEDETPQTGADDTQTVFN